MLSEYLTYVNWGMFTFYTLGAVGGIVFLVNHIVDKIIARSIAKDEKEYDPWGPSVYRYEEPMPHMNEAPISGRKK